MEAEMRNAEKDLKYLMRFARGDIEAIARHWINRALELETENLRLQKEVDRLLERERHAVHHSETYKRLVERTREVDKVRKEVERLREALQTIAFPVKHFQQEAEKAGATLDGEMVMALSNDAGWMKDVARKALEEGKEND
jgi:hypothetical protein